MEVAYKGYQELDKSARHIRLMRLHAVPRSTSGNDPDVVSCSLERLKLADANPFHALSYVWGPATSLNPILLDNQTVFIRRNLWLFLRSLRERFCKPVGEDPASRPTIRVWVDYICIDQNNMLERSYQVSMMGDIYRAADAVYAWLGDAKQPLDEGLEGVKNIEHMRAHNLPWLQIYKEQQRSDTGLMNVALSPYWTRLWIKQEVILAKDVWFFYGQDVVNWKAIRFAANLTQNKTRVSQGERISGDVNNTRSPSKVSKQAMNSLLDARASHLTDVGLAELVTKFQDAGCQDARDRIYALLALVDPSISQQIQVDYEKPLLQILLENYPHWTGDHSPWSENYTVVSQVPLYQFQSFLSQIRNLLPDSELNSLYHSEAVREAVIAEGSFRTSAPSMIESVYIIAVMDRNSVRTRSFLHGLDSGSCGFVMKVVVRAPLSGQPKYRRELLLYADSQPGEGDLLASIGSRAFFLRYSHAESQIVTNDFETAVLLGTGTEVSARSLMAMNGHRLSTQYLAHPCLWVRRQLSDASFDILSTPSKSTSKLKAFPTLAMGFQVLCNAAAIVTLLLESNMFKTAVPDDCRSVASQQVDRSENLDGDGMLPESWSPYVFGLEHGILNPCRFCKMTGRNAFNHNRHHYGRDEVHECECRWESHSKR